MLSLNERKIHPQEVEKSGVDLSKHEKTTTSIIA